MNPRYPVLGLLLLLLSPLIILTACGERSGEEIPVPAAENKVIVLGLDAATWKIIDPLLERGQLPHLASLLERGCRAPLETLYPTISPQVWTSIATGVPAALHGRDFTLTRIPGSYRFSQDTGNMLAYPALWQVADHYGLTSVTVNWYSAESPWEPIRSRVLADRIVGEQAVPRRMPPFDLPGLRFNAPDDAALFESLSLPGGDALRRDALRPWLRHELNVLRWRYGEDDYFHRAALELLFETEEGQPDLAMVFLRSLDGVQHKFWSFMDEEHFPDVDPGERDLLGGVVEAFYRYYDRVIGDYLERAEPGTTFVIVSDHGMEPIHAQTGRTVPDDETVRRNMSLHRPTAMDHLLERMGLYSRTAEGKPDWSRTSIFPNPDKALSWEAGFCLNVKGREPQGIIAAGDCDRMLVETAERLGRIRTVDGSEPLFSSVTLQPEDPSSEILTCVNPRLSPAALLEVEGSPLPMGDLLEAYDLAAAHLFAPDGILVLAGPDIRPGSRLDSASIYDVAPTICSLLGLPPASDFSGALLQEAFEPPAGSPDSARTVASYRDVVPGFEPEAGDRGSSSLEPVGEDERERLRSLGYIQ